MSERPTDFIDWFAFGVLVAAVLCVVLWLWR